MKYSSHPLADGHVNEFNALCPLNEFRVYAPDQINSGLLQSVPQGLWDKSDNLLLMSSGSAVATAYCMINCSRFDDRANEIDQEPIFFAHYGGEPRLDRIIIHHGDWPGRTIPVPPDFHSYLTTSGLGNYYPLSNLPTSTAGPIIELAGLSHIAAFDKGVQKIIQMANEEAKKEE